VLRPRPAQAVIDGCWRAIFGRAIAPAASALENMHDPADDPAIVYPPPILLSPRVYGRCILVLDLYSMRRPALAKSTRRFDTEPSSDASRSVLSYMVRPTNPSGCSQPSPRTKQRIQPSLLSLRRRVCRRPPTNPSVHSQPSPTANQKIPFRGPPEFHASACASH
jgi:hypothetical protein